MFSRFIISLITMHAQSYFCTINALFLRKNEGPFSQNVEQSSRWHSCRGAQNVFQGHQYDYGVVNKFPTRCHIKLSQPSGKDTLVPSAGMFNIFGSGPSFFEGKSTTHKQKYVTFIHQLATQRQTSMKCTLLLCNMCS